jgi:hypothetical protein
MRNPLSAILQCSDEISTSLTEFRSLGDDVQSGQKLLDILDSSIDAAQTIALCAQHQVGISVLRWDLSLISLSNRNELWTISSRCPSLTRHF